MIGVSLGITAELCSSHLLSKKHLVALFSDAQTSLAFAPNASGFLWSFVFLKNLVATLHQKSAVQVELCHGHILSLKGGAEPGPQVTDVTH